MLISRRRLLAASPLLLLPAGFVRAAENGAPSTSADGTFPEFTEKSDKAVKRGVDWVMKTMHRDGGCGVDIGQPSDIGCSAMVGLALLSQGNTPVEGPRSRELRQIVSFMLRTVESMPENDITAQDRTQLQNKIGRHAQDQLGEAG